MSVMADRSGRMPRQERRAQLLDAARDAFVHQGYHAAGMDAIAERAGVSKPVLYQHFPGKLELYLAVLDQSSGSLITLVKQALDSTHDNRKRVRATFEAYFDFVAHESGAFRLIFESDLTNVPEATSRVARTNETCAELIAEVIREDTELDEQTSMLLASGLLGMAQTSARRWLHAPAHISQQEAARAMSALAWRGISGFPLSAHPAAGSGPGSAGAATAPGADRSPDPAPTAAAAAGTAATAPAAAAPTTPAPSAGAARATPARSGGTRARGAGKAPSGQARPAAGPGSPAAPTSRPTSTTRTATPAEAPPTRP